MKKKELLIEIGCEELPADWLDPIVHSLENQFRTELLGAGIEVEGLECFSTPRRLVVHAPLVGTRQADRHQRIWGPPATVAPDGLARSLAANAFARRHKASVSDLKIGKRKRGDYLFLERIERGRRTSKLLPSLLETVLRSLTFPKTMQWDASVNGQPFAFGRPIRWLIFIFGGKIVPFRIDVSHGEPVVAGRQSRGHRFHARIGRPGQSFRVDCFASLEEGLRRRFVILDSRKRRQRLLMSLGAAAGGIGASSFESPSLHHNLVEYPGAVAGRYSPLFRVVPSEVRRAVLVEHQKYLPVRRKCAFLAVTNVPGRADQVVRRGTERVVRARLRDALFFWEESRSTKLAERYQALEQIVFHRKFGSLREHCNRVKRLATWTARQVGADDRVAADVALLAKCDLTTTLVGEFPSLQGVVGGRILRSEGVPRQIWRAVYDHYRPVGLHGPLPKTLEGAVVALADRSATLAGLFVAGELPASSGDTFGLRRSALALLRILRDGPVVFSKSEPTWPTPSALLREAVLAASDRVLHEEDLRAVWGRLRTFVKDRLAYSFEEQGIERGVIRAVLAVRTIDHSVADTWLRIRSLHFVARSESYAILAAAHKRVRRILPLEVRETRGSQLNPTLLVEPAEHLLFAALLQVEEQVSVLSARTAYRRAFRRLAELAPAVNTFFDDVLVMAEDPAVRANRLSLLARLDALFSEVGDLSQIEASAS